MAIYYDNLELNHIKKFEDSWEGQTGQDVEDFITRKLKNPIGPNITYEGETLTIYNSEGDPIASGIVSPVEPEYITTLRFDAISVNGDYSKTNIEVNYNESSKFAAGINIKTYYSASGNDYDLASKVTVIFSIEGTTKQLVVKDVIPNKKDDDSLQFIDITPLFQSNLINKLIKATVITANNLEDQLYAGNITVHKIELSTKSTYVDNNTMVFNIEGLSAIGDLFLEYYAIKLGSDPANYLSSDSADLTGTTSTELKLSESGAYQILARITNKTHSYYSNWVQANVVSYDSSESESLMVIIGGIPNTINNCENANLYQIISVPGLGGSAEIVSYLTDEPGNFNKSDWSLYEFNYTSINVTANDEPSVTSYYSYIEMLDVSDQLKAVAFKLKIDNNEYPIYLLSVNSKGVLEYALFFTINVQQNPDNINNAFNFTEGPKEDFSQITGQSTSLFTNINEDIEASDGWIVDENLTAYKISGQDKNLFKEAKDLSTLITSGLGFSIEVMLKNYNINGDDPVMNIGSLIFGPGYARIDYDDKDEDEGIYVNSRADFEKETITHLIFTFDPNYKPNTYNNIYNLLFNEDGLTYESINHTYPILKVYVNGCINREIQIDPQALKNNEGFKLLIHPVSSDLNLYIFRTYTKALSYEEIKKNFISSRTTSKEKKDIYDRNDILSTDGRISFYKCMLKHNVIVFVLPKDDKPLYYGNKDTAGDGDSKATILVRYKNEEYKYASGRLTGGKYKCQGSSAKKYMFHNTQYSKGTFLSEEQIAAGITEGDSKYAIPTDPEGIKAEKLVGKVNYASSMQSHKLGATKLYDRAYKELFGVPYNGGKKACLEEDFLYFYYNVDDDSKLDTITIEDLYTTETINGITVADDSNVKFLGFQTWGSAKADDPTFGYDEDKTPEYVLFEGADNASPGANFKQPWAAFQTWDSLKTKLEHAIGTGKRVQQTSNITSETIAGVPNPNYDPTVGLLIEGETILFENDTDPLDVDYGVELIQLEGQSKQEAEDRDLWKFTQAVKNNSLPYFVKFYNNCYQYDFTNLIPNPDPDKENPKFDLKNTYKSTDKRIYMTVKTALYMGDKNTNTTADTFTVYRWDAIEECWVPAGLHYSDGKWETFNLKSVYIDLKNTDLYKKYLNDPEVITEDFNHSINSYTDIDTYIIPAFKDMFKATCKEYVDIEDVAYHQAFIRVVSGTDNRAKNTYFQIVGKLYAENEETGKWEKTDVGDYKIRLLLDDLDTIFATDNNGQQVKPYYLLEPAFNKSTEDMWGDKHSAFFYPFDVCYYDKINDYTGKIIKHLFGSNNSVKDINSNLYDYFFKVQLNFPEIAYNHHAEIYYEVPLTLYANHEQLLVNGNIAFVNTLSGFSNNNVKNPLSLSHGRCLESEYLFMKDRLTLLGTATLTASGLYNSDRFNISTASTGGSTDAAVLKGKVTYTDYFYPVRSTTTSREFFHIGNITSKENTPIIYDNVFAKILTAPAIPTTISRLVTPNYEFDFNSNVNTVMGTYINVGSKYKKLHITLGLEFTHSLLTLPNAQELVIDGNLASYSIIDSNIVVSEKLPVIEKLILTNVSFINATLDFRGCNRLQELNLSGCTGIVDIIFPENNRLNTVYLPSGIKNLTLGKNPNLSTFVFSENTRLTNISLDCSYFHPLFDYMDILTNRIDYSNLESFILRNTPKDGLLITELVAVLLATVKLNTKNVLINGTFNITNRSEEIINNEIVYTWEDPVDISYNTKKHLVKTFGNIDLVSNLVYFKYKISTLLRNSAVIEQTISVDLPDGGNANPFDSLYFKTGNNINITNLGKLDIIYSISNFPSSVGSLDPNSGVLTLNPGQNKGNTYNYSILVSINENGIVQKLETITGYLYLGYREPEIGDYAFGDGTFSNYPSDDKNLIGLVFQKEVITPGEEWQLGILSVDSISEVAGPDYYYWVNTGNNSGFSDYGPEQENIYNYMKSSSGLNITTMTNEPTAAGYLGFNPTDYTPDDPKTVDYNYLTTRPKSLVNSGSEATKRLVEVGKNRLKTISANNASFKSYLLTNGYLSNQGEFVNWPVYEKEPNTSEKDFSDLCDVINTSIKNQGFNSAPYYKVIHPLAFKASLYEPKCLKDVKNQKGRNYYSKGNWYIPSVEELELLIWYRIRSTTAAVNAATSKSNWDAITYNSGSEIFSKTSESFTNFLNNSQMIASDVSSGNDNYIYGEMLRDNLTTYGWFYNYHADSYGWSYYQHQGCRRDQLYTITPCCTITVKKHS